MFIRGLFFFFSYCLCSAHALCYFHPPENWNCYPAKAVTGCLEIGFFKQSTSGLVYSVNLAKEQVTGNLQGYVKAVKEEQKKDRGKTWRDLGNFQTKAGLARLTEITRKTPWGKEKLWQLLFVKEGMAYVLTASSPEKDFSALRSTFVKVFRSLTYTEDLIGEIQEKEKRLELEAFLSSFQDSSNRKKILPELEKMLAQKCPEMGKHWQFLLLKKYYPKNP